MVRKGQVDLKKNVTVEQTNFMSLGKDEYYRRVKSNKYAHIVGLVKVGDYFGLLESLTDATQTQIACKFGTASSDGAELVWCTKENLIRGFRRE